MKPKAALALALAATPFLSQAAFVNLTPVPSSKGSHTPEQPTADPADYWYVTNDTSHIAPVDPEESDEIVPSAKIERDTVRAKIAQNRKDTGELYLKNLITKAKLQIGSGAPEVALDSLNNILNLNPEFSEAYVLRGVISAMKKRYGAAIEDYNRAIRFDGSSADAFMSRGIARLRLGQLAEAEEDFDRTLQIDSTFAEAYLKRGFIYAQGGDFARAKADFEKFIALEPANPLGPRNLGAALTRMGKPDEAKAAFRRAAILEQQAKQKN